MNSYERIYNIVSEMVYVKKDDEGNVIQRGEAEVAPGLFKSLTGVGRSTKPKHGIIIKKYARSFGRWAKKIRKRSRSKTEYDIDADERSMRKDLQKQNQGHTGVHGGFMDRKGQPHRSIRFKK